MPHACPRSCCTRMQVEEAALRKEKDPMSVGRLEEVRGCGSWWLMRQGMRGWLLLRQVLLVRLAHSCRVPCTEPHLMMPHVMMPHVMMPQVKQRGLAGLE